MRSPWVALLCLVACRDGSPPNEQPARRPAEESLRERVFNPSPGLVRSVGPYAITESGVGLYALGTEMRAVLAMFPNAPVDQLDLEGVVKFKVVPTDDDRIQVGFDPSGVAAYVAVIAPDIAMVDGRFGIGSEIDEVVEGLGPPIMDRAVRDPHLVALAKAPHAGFVVDGDQVTAILVTREARKPVAEPLAAQAAGSPCARAAEILAGSLPEPHDAEDSAYASYGCFTGTAPEIAIPEGEELVVYGGEPGRLKRVGAVAVPGLLFSGALDVDRDGHSEIVSVSERRSGEALAARIVVWRGEGGRLVEVADKEVYRMTSGSAGWVGAKLKDVRFILEVLPENSSSVEVRGVYLQGGDDSRVHTVAPLMPETVAVRPRRAPTSGGAGGAGAPATPGGPASTPKGHEPGKTDAGGKPDRGGGSKGAEGKKPDEPKKAPPVRRGGSPAGGAKRDASDM